MFPSRIVATNANSFFIAISFCLINHSGSSSNSQLMSEGKIKSTSNLGNRPNSIWKCDTPVVACISVLYANANGSKYSFQSSKFSWMKHRIILSRVRLNRSVRPSHCGWYGVVRDLSKVIKHASVYNTNGLEKFGITVRMTPDFIPSWMSDSSLISRMTTSPYCSVLLSYYAFFPP